MKAFGFAGKVLAYARAIGSPEQAPGPGQAADGSFPALVCDNSGVLWVRQVTAGSGGISFGGAPSTASANNNPGAGVKASASIPADASGHAAKNVIVKISWSLGDSAVGATGTIVLRDGASGVGAILWQKQIGPLPANGYWEDSESWPLGAGIAGSATTAMTLEFLAAPSATGTQSVALTGYLAT